GDHQAPEPDGLTERRDGVVDPAQLHEGQAKIAVGPNIIRLAPNGLSILADRFLELPVFTQSAPQVIVWLALLRMKPNRLPELGNGLRHAILHVEHTTEVRVSHRVNGLVQPEPNRFLVLLDGLVERALRRQSVAKVVVGRRPFGVETDGFAVRLAGIFERSLL